MNFNKKFLCFLFFIAVTHTCSAQTLPFENRVYAINCEQAPFEIAVFNRLPSGGLIAYYPRQQERRSSALLNYSEWGFFSHKEGDVFKFQTNGRPESRALWMRLDQIAFVKEDGQFRENQRFFKWCNNDSAAINFLNTTKALENARANYLSQVKAKEDTEKFQEKAKCVLFEAARQSCAAAGSYPQCMTIRWGENWSVQDNICR